MAIQDRQAEVAADPARRERLRALSRLTPGERIERLIVLNRQLFELRDDARAARMRR